VPSQPVQQRGVKPDAVDGPKASSVLIKTSPSKQPAANQDAGDGRHVVDRASNQIAVDNVGRVRTPSGDSPQTTSPTKNVYISGDSTSGALINTAPYPREVLDCFFLLVFVQFAFLFVKSIDTFLQTVLMIMLIHINEVTLHRARLVKKKERKEVYLYSAFLHQGTHKALRHGSHSFTCKQHHACISFVPFTRCHHHSN